MAAAALGAMPKGALMTTAEFFKPQRLRLALCTWGEGMLGGK